MRLLHDVIGQILVPKAEKFDVITERELMLMVVLVQGTIVNLLGIMFR